MDNVRNRLVFFTTDAGYLFPTLSAAVQVVRQPAVAAAADVGVFLVGLDAKTSAYVREEFEPYGLIFFNLDPAEYIVPDYAIFAEGHVPPSALARLVVAGHIPARYEHLVYLDGDIQIVGDIMPLVGRDVEPGKVLAATDANVVCSSAKGGYGSSIRSYAGKLGVERVDLYFNSGVMAFRRKTWATIGPAAMSFLRSNTALCKYHDQSALNAVVGSRREILHPSFNYAPLFDRLAVNDPKPVVIHFFGRSKPWQRACALWGGRWYASYEALAADHPFLYDFWDRGAAANSISEKTRGIGRYLRDIAQRRRLSRYLRMTKFALKP